MGRNILVLIVFMSRAVGDGVCEALSHNTWEDGDLNIQMKHALCETKRTNIPVGRGQDDDMSWRFGNNGLVRIRPQMFHI